MAKAVFSVQARQGALAAAFLCALASIQPASAADDPIDEQQQLAALGHQLDLLDRLVEHGAVIAPRERARYHFDYVRLRADIDRIRVGVRDYLTPQRAQPRDPVEIAGTYRTERLNPTRAEAP